MRKLFWVTILLTFGLVIVLGALVEWVTNGYSDKVTLHMVLGMLLLHFGDHELKET